MTKRITPQNPTKNEENTPVTKETKQISTIAQKAPATSLLQNQSPSKSKSVILLALPISVILIFSLGAVSGYMYYKQFQAKQTAATEKVKEDPYIAFLDEIYDKIKENYWDKITDENLANLFKLGTEKLAGSPADMKTMDKEGLNQTLKKVLKNLEEGRRKDFTANLANLVLANLNPFGRSGLYTGKLETQLKNTVSNINPEKDLYKDLGIGREASPEEIQKAFQKTKALLESQKESSPEAIKKLEEITYAYEVLSNIKKKETYDLSGVEPTVSAKIIKGGILYLPIKKVSPTTYEEIQNDIKTVKEEKGLNTLILDLRGNIGGSIDLLPYLLGPFIGQNQYAYEYLHQNETTPYKTKTGFLPELVRYKKVVILIDEHTQSSAEVMAATLKRYNVGITLGTTTKGWGTIERVFPLDHQIDPAEKFSMFLVHTLTLREDGQPIEGRGVDPMISIKDPNWEDQLNEYFNSPSLVQAIKTLYEPKR